MGNMIECPRTHDQVLAAFAFCCDEFITLILTNESTQVEEDYAALIQGFSGRTAANRCPRWQHQILTRRIIFQNDMIGRGCVVHGLLADCNNTSRVGLMTVMLMINAERLKWRLLAPKMPGHRD